VTALNRIADHLRPTSDGDARVIEALHAISGKLGEVTAAIGKVETAVLALDDQEEDHSATIFATGFDATGAAADTTIGNWLRHTGFAGLRDVVKGPRGAPPEAAREDFVQRMRATADQFRGLPQKISEGHLRRFFNKAAAVVRLLK
jgi:hypothetical protein